METLKADRALAARAMEDYGDMVLRLACQRLGSMADAEDTAQEVFLSLMGQREFRGEEHLRRWLVRVTLNKCSNLAASAWWRRTAPLCEGLPALAPEEREALEEVRALPPKDRDVIYLHYYEGYTIAEIADLLGEKPNTVGARLTRARKKLKILLEEAQSHG